MAVGNPTEGEPDHGSPCKGGQSTYGGQGHSRRKKPFSFVSRGPGFVVVQARLMICKACDRHPITTFDLEW